MFAIIVASILFSTLLSVRFFESTQVEMNGKYRSIKFASQRQNDVDSSKIVKVEPRKQDNAKQQEKYIKKEKLNEPEAQKKVEHNLTLIFSSIAPKLLKALNYTCILI